ncbi:MAG: DUF6544 family protein [Pseudomonadota bacterium]
MLKVSLILLGLIALLSIGSLWAQSPGRRDTSLSANQIRVSATRRPQTVDLSEIRDLPAPVKKYFRLVLKDGAPIIHTVSMSQTGGFRAKPDIQGWSNLQAQQLFSTRPPAFVWDASIAIVPGITIHVRDSYLNGKGAMRVKLFSLLPLMDVQNKRELNEAALQRYLAEAVWFPTALLPSQGVTWSELAPHRASASITDSGNRVSLEFEFNVRGEIISIYSPARYREVSGAYEPTPWKGYFSDYIEVDGYLIPTSAKVEWHLPDQVYPYWQAKLHNIRYPAD